MKPRGDYSLVAAGGERAIMDAEKADETWSGKKVSVVEIDLVRSGSGVEGCHWLDKSPWARAMCYSRSPFPAVRTSFTEGAIQYVQDKHTV